MPPYEALTGADRVDWVLEHTAGQVAEARAELATVDPGRLQLPAQVPA